ncbi:MAG: homoserine O-succinyltransferase [Amphiplicatus sp.]|nr:homoserine O-succinyltransferase [Amphiplicatus sp.]MCB9954774.1 homoserine O-succinyltransferase [Caulobacterales bacterium]
MGVAKAEDVNDGDCSPGASVLLSSDREIDLGETFRLESGETLNDRRLRVRLTGPEGAPVVVVSGGISAGRKVADAEDGPGWWRDIVNKGGAVDMSRHRILGFDFLPGDEKEALTITPDDQARALAHALDALDIETIHGFVGASYGGFVGLAFAARYPKRIARLSVVSAAARPDPMATALRGIQRRIILLGWKSGKPEEGVALARELAMTTYRSADEFRGRFSSAPLGPHAGDPYDVCGYLISRGEAYARAMSAPRYLTLSDSLDRANIDLSKVVADCLFIASKTDRLVPAADTEAASRGVKGRSSYLAIESLVGHDAFLCDAGEFSGQLKEFIERG